MSYYGTPDEGTTQGIISTASNVRGGTNPAYTTAMFWAAYPSFQGLVSEEMTQMYINLANAVIKESRYHSYWQVCMNWFIAHFLTLYLQSISTGTSQCSAKNVLAAGEARGLKVHKAVDGLSVGLDYSQIGDDLAGWAQFKLTIYGQQFASIAKLMGRAGSFVW